MTNPPAKQRQIFSISQLNRQAKRLLEHHFPAVWVEGEISNLACPSSGHWYFSLKDSSSQVRCAMFRGNNQRLRFKAQSGQKVVARARLSLYEARGDYQLIVEYMEPAGAGDLARAFEELKARLTSEGLLEPALKKPLPEHPKHIALITSPSGAAIHDMLTVFKRRFPSIALTLLPTAVQGEGAAAQIAFQIGQANHLVQYPGYEFDAIIVGRGGGSQEDLWAFNEEVVARAIAASQLPVVSAVGHEVDYAISDFIADARAPTPSAAAEMLSPNGRELMETFAGYELLLKRAINSQIQQRHLSLSQVSSRLQHPGHRLNEQRQRLDEMELRLTSAVNRHQQQAKYQLQLLLGRLHQQTPQQKIAQLALKHQNLNHRLKRQSAQSINNAKREVAHLAQRLQTVSPLATLERGYAIVSHGDAIVRRSEEVKVGDTVQAKLSNGQLLCRVETIKE